jgi:hypothetical protein
MREMRKKESGEVVRNTTWGGGRKYVSGVKGSQAVPARPSGRGNAYERNYFYDVGRAEL